MVDFDSTVQARLFAEHGPTEATSRLITSLRVVDLLGSRTVITAAEVLDGLFFLLLGPEGVLDCLGMDVRSKLPLMVSGLTESLASEWDRLIHPTNHGRQSFSWSSDSVAHTVGWNSSRLTRARQAWIRAATAGQIDFLHVDRSSLDMGSARQQLTPIPNPPLQRLWLGLPDNRSDAYTLIADADVTDLAKRDLRRWYDTAYSLAIARQHQAELLEINPSGDMMGPRLRTESRTIIKASTPLSGAMTDDLAAMTGAIYSFTRQRTETARLEWHRSSTALGRNRALKSLSYGVRLVSSDHGHTWVKTVRRLILSSLLVIVAAVAAFLVSIEVLTQPFIVAFIAFIGLCLQVPWSRIPELRDTAPKRLDAYLSMKVTNE